MELDDVIQEVMTMNAAMAYRSDDGEELADYSKFIPMSDCPNARLFMKSCKAQFQRKVTNYGTFLLIPIELEDKYDNFKRLENCWVKDKALAYYIKQHPATAKMFIKDIACDVVQMNRAFMKSSPIGEIACVLKIVANLVIGNLCKNLRTIIYLQFYMYKLCFTTYMLSQCCIHLIPKYTHVTA